MEEKRFGEKIMETISGPSRKRVPITFPEPVLNEFMDYAKNNSADCYWLAIQQLLHFYREQTEGDLKTLLVMDQIKKLETRIDELELKLVKPVETKKEFKTFGKGDEK